MITYGTSERWLIIGLRCSVKLCLSLTLNCVGSPRRWGQFLVIWICGSLFLFPSALLWSFSLNCFWWFQINACISKLETCVQLIFICSFNLICAAGLAGIMEQQQNGVVCFFSPTIPLWNRNSKRNIGRLQKLAFNLWELACHFDNSPTKILKPCPLFCYWVTLLYLIQSYLCSDLTEFISFPF